MPYVNQAAKSAALDVKNVNTFQTWSMATYLRPIRSEKIGTTTTRIKPMRTERKHRNNHIDHPRMVWV